MKSKLLLAQRLLNLMMGIFLVENMAGTLLHCAYFLTLVYLEAPVSEEMETDTARDMLGDTTAIVSDDEVDVSIA